MALPTANLTLHLDASAVTDLWQIDTAGSFSDHPVDGEVVSYWDDVEHADIVAGTVGTDPVWRSSSPGMLLPCVEFDGTHPGDPLRLFANNGTTAKALSAVVSASAHTLLIALSVDSVLSTSGSGSVENYDGILTESGTYFLIGVSHPSGYVLSVNIYTSSSRYLEFPISLATSYVLMTRHEAGTLYASINGGAESSISAANIASVAGTTIRLGTNASASFHFDGRIGEVAIWNVALTGSNLTDAISYFTAKWLGGPAASPAVFPRTYRPFPFTPGAW